MSKNPLDTKLSNDMALTLQTFAKAVKATKDRAERHWFHISDAMKQFNINTPAREAAFLAQIGHESGGLQWVKELWGPTPAQVRYEGRKDLGNTEPGDGFKYRGRGWIQVTGRFNYKKTTERLSDMGCPDFEDNPDALADPQWAALSAAEFWSRNGCNELADAGDFKRITKVINGGLNGYEDRVARLEVAEQAIA